MAHLNPLILVILVSNIGIYAMPIYTSAPRINTAGSTCSDLADAMPGIMVIEPNTVAPNKVTATDRLGGGAIAIDPRTITGSTLMAALDAGNGVTTSGGRTPSSR